eukprot:TRINITY_DN1733_c0_g1_i1.p1 TRINITY_DN1733_c0_g1~~TRINITY_DN1733_c0_g1_i1.p1  ORF type:complete len:248 (+),score=81.63 TRINITY_DN1733_c0_g1_i1:36-746(+)
MKFALVFLSVSIFLGLTFANVCDPYGQLKSLKASLEVDLDQTLTFEVDPCAGDNEVPVKFVITGGTATNQGGVDGAVVGSDDNSVSIKYSHGDKCYYDGYQPAYTTTIKFICDAGFPGNGNLSYVSGPKTYCVAGGPNDFYFDWKTSVVCSYIGGGGSSGFGKMFFIILIVGIILYLGIGMGLKYKQHGARGIEMIPHLGFWKQVPGWTIAGAGIVIGKIKGLIKRDSSRAGYEAI